MITDGVTDPADGHAVRTGDLIPQIAVDDSSGALYVVWQDDRFTGEEQIAFSRSTDGGRTWSATRRISTVGGVNQAFTATPRVASNGTVAVQYYDFRFDNPNGDAVIYFFWGYGDDASQLMGKAKEFLGNIMFMLYRDRWLRLEPTSVSNAQR